MRREDTGHPANVATNGGHRFAIEQRGPQVGLSLGDVDA